MTQLTEQFCIPEAYHAACDRLTALVQNHTRRLLEDEYWADDHLQASQHHTGQSYTYIRDHEYDAFADVDEYVYSRFKRCVYHRVAHVLDAHREEYHTFHFITDVVEERKIRRLGWQRIRHRLFEDADSPYLPWSVVETVVEKLNTYYDRHGCFPPAYTELVATPEPNGTLPYAPDKGDYHIHDVELHGGKVVVVLNAPDTLSPDSYHDWTDHRISFHPHQRFRDMIDAGDGLGAPTLHESSHGYTIDLPVDVPACEVGGEDGRVLAVDLGVKKQVTCVPVERDDSGDHRQVAPPTFIDHHTKDKLFRVKADAEGINDRLSALRRGGRAHTDRFDHLLAEYRQTRRKERRLRAQIQHDVANQLVWIALVHDCSAIVFESLGGLDGSWHDGTTAWSISTWARGKLLDAVEYKAELLGIEFETVNPWGTSRYCPRCGEKGNTVKAPNDHTEQQHGGHFHCPSCGYECDRDVVGAINVGRKHLDGCRMERANPAAYTAAGKHASFPSHLRCARSAADAGMAETASVSGVQSPPETGSVSGWQTHLSQDRTPSLTAKRSGAEGGLSRNESRNTGLRYPSGSITEYVLTSTTDSDQLLPNPTEN